MDDDDFLDDIESNDKLKRQTLKVIEAGASNIDDQLSIERKFIPQEFGLCSHCKNFIYQCTMYNHEMIICDVYFANDLQRGLPPSRKDPIKQCSNFYEKGQMSLREMNEIAIIINNKTKNKVGF